MTPRGTAASALTPAKTPREYLAEQLRGNVLFQAVVLFLASAVATSRATDGVLSGSALAAIAAGAALTSGTMGWVSGLYEGAHHRLEGAVAAPVAPAGRRSASHAPGDVFDAPMLWRRAVAWGLGGMAWAGAGAVLTGGVLDGRSAPLGVVVAALVLLVGAAAASVNLAARATGLAVAATSAPPVVPMTGPVWSVHRRAWLDLALPIALVQLALNAGVAWVLFHDYATNDPRAEGVLTRGDALADVGLVVALLTGILGLLAVRWGRVDVALGRVTVDERVRSGVSAKAPLGTQGLVYVALAALILSRVAGWFLPALPGLMRVVSVRGLFAGVLAFVVVGVAYARGAVNAAAGAANLSPTAPPVARRPRRGRSSSPRGARPVPAMLVMTLAVVAGVAMSPTVTPRRAVADTTAVISLDQRDLAAEAEAFGVRVEYDLPVPAGTGSVPRAVGKIGIPSDQNAWGLAGAPSHFDPVVGGTYYDPVKDDDPIEDGQQTDRLPDNNRLPVAECFHPGNTLDTTFSFPTNTRDETASVPATGYGSARCSEGPEVEVHARVNEVGGPGTATEGGAPVVTAGTGAADALIRPVEGVLRAEASARLTDVSLLGGALTVDAIEVAGSSSVTGQPGAERTEARVNLIGVEAGGARFSLRDGGILVGDTAVPLGSADARQVVGELNAALVETGCQATVIGPTDRYPQGFLLSRNSPDVGTSDDGTLAASMAGGLLLLCDVPEEISGNTELNPQRIQVLVGFVFTSTLAREEVGGFGLGHLASNLTVPLSPGVAVQGATAVAEAPLPGATGNEPARPAAVANPALSEPAGAPVPAVVKIPGAGWLGEPVVWVLAAALWMVTTHRGVRRLQALLGRSP